MSKDSNIQTKRTRKRPLWLTILCLCSFIGSSFGFLIAVISVVNPEWLSFANQIPGYTSIKSLTIQSIAVYPYLKMTLYAISFWGVFLMFNLKRKGFIFYSAAQFLLLVLPFFAWNETPMIVFLSDLSDYIFTIAFIGSYALYLRDMKNNQEPAGKVK